MVLPQSKLANFLIFLITVTLNNKKKPITLFKSDYPIDASDN